MSKYRMQQGLGSVIIQLMKRCNLDCIMCGQAKSRKSGKTFELSKNTVIGVIDDIKELGFKRVVFTGGEPTLYEELPALISHASRIGLKTEIMSNGYVIDEQYAGMLVESGLDYMTTSVHHSTPEYHDKVTKVSGSWQRTMDAISNLKKLNPDIRFGFIFTMNSFNYRDSLKVLALAKRKGVGTLIMSHIVFSEPHVDKRLKLSERQMKEFYFLIAPSLLSLGEKTGIDVIFFPTFSSLMGKSPKYQAKMLMDNPENFEEEILNFSRGEYAIGKYDRLPCTTALTSSRVLSSGDVTICCDSEHADFGLGNVNKRRFKDIWKSEKYRKLRDIGRIPKYDGCVVCKRPFVLGGVDCICE